MICKISDMKKLFMTKIVQTLSSDVNIFRRTSSHAGYLRSEVGCRKHMYQVQDINRPCWDLFFDIENRLAH